MTGPVPLTAEDWDAMTDPKRLDRDRSTPSLDADRHLPDCDAPGPDEPCTCVSRADRSTPSVDGLDVERLAEAMVRLTDRQPPGHRGRRPGLQPIDAPALAAEYAALAATPTPAPEAPTRNDGPWYRGPHTPSVDGLREALASKRGDWDDGEFGGMWRPDPEGGVVNWDDIEAALAATPTPVADDPA